MMGNIENYLKNYKKTECPSITSDGMLFSRFGIEMVLFDKILAKSVVRVSQVWTDSPGDLQIDGLCILIDGELVTDIVEAKNLIVMKGGIEHVQKIELYFIQSKSKKNFSVGEFNHFTAGVQNFVTNSHVPVGVNTKIENWFRIWKIIDDDIRRNHSHTEVVANLFIVFNGDTLDHELLVDQMKNFQQNLPRCCTVTQVKYKAIGTTELIEIYKRRTAASQSQKAHVSRPANRPFVHKAEETHQPRHSFENRTNPHRYESSVSINEVKNAIRQCNQDPNGYVFLADLGAKVNVNGSLKYYLAKYPLDFQFDNSRCPNKVKIVGESYHTSASRPQPFISSSLEKRNELKNIISGLVISVDTDDWSGTIETSGYGCITFYFSDLVNPEQETELTPGSFVRFEVTTWGNMTKVKNNTLKVI